MSTKIDTLFKKLIEKEGSDLHLKQGAKPRMRLHGSIVDIAEEPILTASHLVEMLQEIADPHHWNHFETTGDLDFAYAMGNQARFRVNYFRHVKGYGAVFRIIPSNIKSLKDLQLPDSIKNLTELNSGLVLITGPTGSGKSTTLAALIHEINQTSSKKIITIEEPVEFIHKNQKSIITHREVGLDTKGFTEGLKSAIKSNVNIILVGEMRDQETIKLALAAAEMGILVFGTLHTNSAAKTIDRIVDAFPTNQKAQIRITLANVLKGVVSQQLLKSIDDSRRWIACEILLRSPALGAIIQNGETVKIVSEIQMNRQKGMILMDESIRQLVLEGKVSKDEGYKKAIDKSSFTLP